MNNATPTLTDACNTQNVRARPHLRENIYYSQSATLTLQLLRYRSIWPHRKTSGRPNTRWLSVKHFKRFFLFSFYPQTLNRYFFYFFFFLKCVLARMLRTICVVYLLRRYAYVVYGWRWRQLTHTEKSERTAIKKKKNPLPKSRKTSNKLFEKH